MGLAADTFHWSADQFWSATPHEFWAMIDARIDAGKAR
ncbi:phage tail assembly chaperone [uncultured Sphingomonas sp.]|nr:phage tail assembly chaperone [uncultured Sphingomonas sp.]